MTTTVKRSVPPPTLVKMGNPLVRILLGSPLHGMLDHSFLVLHMTGRKTGAGVHQTGEIPFWITSQLEFARLVSPPVQDDRHARSSRGPSRSVGGS